MNTPEWTYERLQSLITDQIEESLYLDYKAADALLPTDGKRKEITKDVSAMANSAGGTIIYGIKEFDDELRKHLPEAINAVDRKTFSKEQLDQVINTISPRISGVVIHPVSVPDDDTGVVYVVEIPKGTTAHQARDHRYYKRFNFQSTPMEDYEVRDVMGRLDHPVIEPEFEIHIMHHKAFTRSEFDSVLLKPTHPAYNSYDLIISLRNTGSILANYVHCIFLVPLQILHESIRDHYHVIDGDAITYAQIGEGNTIRDLLDSEIQVGGWVRHKYGPSRYDPVLPRLRHRCDAIQLRDDLDLASIEDLSIHWEVFVDNGLPREGATTIATISKQTIQGEENR